MNFSSFVFSEIFSLAVCATHTSHKPFLCMDLCYITALFRKGYHFEPTTELYVSTAANF